MKFIIFLCGALSLWFIFSIHFDFLSSTEQWRSLFVLAPRPNENRIVNVSIEFTVTQETAATISKVNFKLYQEILEWSGTLQLDGTLDWKEWSSHCVTLRVPRKVASSQDVTLEVFPQDFHSNNTEAALRRLALKIIRGSDWVEVERANDVVATRYFRSA